MGPQRRPAVDREDDHNSCPSQLGRPWNEMPPVLPISVLGGSSDCPEPGRKRSCLFLFLGQDEEEGEG